MNCDELRSRLTSDFQGYVRLLRDEPERETEFLESLPRCPDCRSPLELGLAAIADSDPPLAEWMRERLRVFEALRLEIMDKPLDPDEEDRLAEIRIRRGEIAAATDRDLEAVRAKVRSAMRRGDRPFSRRGLQVLAMAAAAVFALIFWLGVRRGPDVRGELARLRDLHGQMTALAAGPRLLEPRGIVELRDAVNADARGELEDDYLVIEVRPPADAQLERPIGPPSRLAYDRNLFYREGQLLVVWNLGWGEDDPREYATPVRSPHWPIAPLPPARTFSIRVPPVLLQAESLEGWTFTAVFRRYGATGAAGAADDPVPFHFTREKTGDLFAAALDSLDRSDDPERWLELGRLLQRLDDAEGLGALLARFPSDPP